MSSCCSLWPCPLCRLIGYTFGRPSAEVVCARQRPEYRTDESDHRGKLVGRAGSSMRSTRLRCQTLGRRTFFVCAVSREKMNAPELGQALVSSIVSTPSIAIQMEGS
eukprot:scaffold191444_cov41-Tisochrysis_lutea.AAC.1